MLQSITYVLLRELPPWGNNLATIKYLNIQKILVFENKLANVFKVACESRQFRNPEFFKYSIKLKCSDFHMEDHMV